MNIISTHSPSYPIRAVPATRPLIWLQRGWHDLLQHPIASLTYGLLVSGMGLIILSYERHPFFVAAAISVFLLVGPIVSAGLCELSRRSDYSEPADFDSSLKALRPNRDNLLGVANRLFVISVAWFVVSYLIMQSTIESVAPGIHQTVWGDVMHSLSSEQIAAYLFSGAVLAVMVFVMSIVTVPMIIDRHVDATTAIKTSLRVSLKDLPAMLLWAAMIVLLMLLGFATFLVAMVVIFPLLGHATWYAYRDLVRQ